MPPVIDSQKCSQCGLCATICPMHVFTHEVRQSPVVAWPEECWHCNACGLDCPAGAVSLRLPLNYMVLNVDAATLHKEEN